MIESGGGSDQTHAELAGRIQKEVPKVHLGLFSAPASKAKRGKCLPKHAVRRETKGA